MDNTCPRVKFVQRIVSDASKKEMDVILVGDKNHSQTNEIIGWIKTRVILIQNIESAMSIIPRLLLNRNTLPAIMVERVSCIYGIIRQYQFSVRT